MGNKKPSVAEIELTLFENCNISCAFCSHDKKSTVGLTSEEMLAKIPVIKSFLKNIDEEVSQVNLHLVGGELLQDRLIKKNILDSYTTLIQEYVALCESMGIESRVIVVSNFLMKEVEAISLWIKEIQKISYLSLIASYDPFGRPLTPQYFKNLKFFKENISNINVVLTKQCINSLMKGSDEFDFLYREFPIFMDDFLPDRKTAHLVPSDEDFSNYLGLVRGKYRKLMPYGESLDYLKTGGVNELQFTTFNKCTIFPDGSVSNYLWDRHTQDLFNIEINYKDNSNMLLSFLKKNSCFSCEYYHACPLRCPVSWFWKGNKRSAKTCVIKEFLYDKESSKG